MILFLGDSISNGVGATSHEFGYAHLVAARLSDRYANWSHGGRTSRHGRAVAEEAILSTLPSLTVIAFGVNDRKPIRRRLRKRRLGRQVAVPVDEFDNNLAGMVWLARRRCGSGVIVVAPPPIPPIAPGYVEAVHRLGVPVAEAAWAAGMDDGFHPTDAGHQALADAVVAAHSRARTAHSVFGGGPPRRAAPHMSAAGQ